MRVKFIFTIKSGFVVINTVEQKDNIRHTRLLCGHFFTGLG